VGVSTLGYCRSSEVGSSGRFGAQSNRCDSPYPLITSTLVYIATRKPKVDFVLVTGDLARRTRGDEVRNQTDHMIDLTAASELLLSLLAEPVILPAIGGSDLWPEGDCEADDPQFAILQNTTWERFLQPWLDTNNKISFLRFGCYNVTMNGFGIIVLNTEFWSFSNGASTVGPSACDDFHVGHNVFIWAESVLEGYKQAGMKVLLAGNRKYADEYVESDGYRPRCLARYIDLAGKYEESIIGHVFGGSHEDSFNLIQNNLDFTRPNITGVIHVSPAVVPVKNPAVRIYEYATAGGTLPAGTLTDYVQYYADILQANVALELTFKQEYRATVAYELPDFSTASWLTLFSKLETDPVMKRKYDLYKSVSSEAVTPTPAVTPPDTLIGVVFTVICGVLVLLAGALAWFKCRSFKYQTYEQELAEGLR